jgi:hypothetical protein
MTYSTIPPHKGVNNAHRIESVQVQKDLLACQTARLSLGPVGTALSVRIPAHDARAAMHLSALVEIGLK